MSGEEDVIEVTIDMVELKKMKVPELKRKVAELALPTKGTKAELLARVEKYLHEQEEEELLEDDEVVEEVVEEEEEEGDVEGSEDVSEEVPATTTTAAAAAAAAVVVDEVEEEMTAEVKGVENDTSKSKQTVPLSGAAAKEGSSQAESLARRAARFGGNSSQEAKKIARAERFGVTLENEFKGLGKRATPTDEELEKMKKRTARFGSSVSPAITSVEDDGKKKLRLERFGQKVTELSAEERKKARETKFETPVKA